MAGSFTLCDRPTRATAATAISGAKALRLPRFEQAGTTVGPYTLLSRIGEGGFGDVWMAERREPMVQRVAIKIMKPGMDSRSVLARFAKERQSLAMMDHPNIARVFDGGITELGRPYFVMELVRGERLTSFCDRHRLTIRQRLSLFLPICHAIRHAHSRGIIHRDLKPSNILVTRRDRFAEPKIIDFGIAKAVSSTFPGDSTRTEQGVLIGTPEYMSPEQAEIDSPDIDQRTDVYSLGVVLYELLTGLTPFDGDDFRGKGLSQVQRIIRECEPPSPSERLRGTRPGELDRIARRRRTTPDQLIAELRSELEWIPRKAMRKARDERYQTPGDFADDVHRYLTARALVAGPDSAAYVARKYIRRHRVALGAAGALAAALAMGFVGTAWQARRASEQSDRVLEAENKGRQKDAAVERERLAKADAQASEADQRRHAAEEEAKRREVEDQLAIEAKRRLEAEADRARSLAAEEIARKDADQAARALEAARASVPGAEDYAINIRAAGKEVGENHPARALERLGACPEALRGPEWRWLHAIAMASVPDVTLASGRVPAGHLAWGVFGPGGSLVAMLGRESDPPSIWSAESGELRAVLEGHQGPVRSIAFGDGGASVITGGNDGTARVWNTSTGSARVTLRGHNGPVRDAAISPDSKRLVTASDDGWAILWDAETFAPIAALVGDGKPVVRSVFTPDSRRVITVSGTGDVSVWDATTAPARMIPKGGSLVPSGEGRVFAYPSNTPQPAFTRSFTDNHPGVQQPAPLSKHWGAFESATGAAVVLSPDAGRLLCTGTDRAPLLRDVSGAGPVRSLGEHSDHVLSVAFSPDGSRVLTVAEDKSLRVWNTDEGTLAWTTRLTSRPGSVRFAGDGAWVMACGPDGRSIRVLSADDGAEIAAYNDLDQPVRDASLDSTGARMLLVCGDGSAQIRSVQPRAGSRTMLGGHSDVVTSAVFSADGSTVATADRDGSIRIWESATGTCVRTIRNTAGRLDRNSLSPDGSLIFVLGTGSTATVYRTRTGTALGTYHSSVHGALTAASFSPGGDLLLTASADSEIQVWDATTMQPAWKKSFAKGRVVAAAFSPSGDRVVAAFSNRSLEVFNATTSASIASIKPPSGDVRSIAFSPDGTKIVTSASDGSVRLWDATLGTPVRTMPAGCKVADAEFSPDGSRIVASGPGLWRVWDARTGAVIADLPAGQSAQHRVLASPDGMRFLRLAGSCSAELWNAPDEASLSPFPAAARVVVVAPARRAMP